ncbi:hypothetical protein K439DRAFT_1624079 [Ramaria rubella]|nr:hypothetical protein K439DRAFT_1624079 [Ramaria rubella]
MVKRLDSLQLVTVLEAVCADRTVVPTPMVLPIGSQPGAWWEQEADGLGGVTTTPAGWTDKKVYLEWFTDIFLKYAKAQNTLGKPILLISDSHRSHETDELKGATFKASVILFSLSPHTTDHLQPLDVGVFGPVHGHVIYKLPQSKGRRSLPPWW